jgi:hypothetical protein
LVAREIWPYFDKARLCGQKAKPSISDIEYFNKYLNLYYEKAALDFDAFRRGPLNCQLDPSVTHKTMESRNLQRKSPALVLHLILVILGGLFLWWNIFRVLSLVLFLCVT